MNQIVENLLPMFQFLLHVLCGYNNYSIENKETKVKMLKNLKQYYCFHYDENKDPQKLVVEKRWFPQFYLYIEESIHSDMVYIFSTEDTFHELIKDNYSKQEITLNEEHIPINDELDEDDECDKLLQEKKSKIHYLILSGSFGHYFINERILSLSCVHNVHWYDYQTTLFRNIMEFYKTNNYCKLFLTGPPGKGKTFFSYLMAEKLNCYLTDSYCPTDPGTSINTIYHRAKNISPNKPLIVVLDEVDIILSRIHNKEVVQHKHYKSEVHDKITWNQLLDRISYGMYPYLILMMVSNKKVKECNKMDPAYLREGRIDIYEEW
jgi:SpoVK/Ycf46/Vps4 family AAA+-type ATPase